MKSQAGQKKALLFPISTVADMTGIKAITLRAWERRYNLITPTRSAKGRRMYSPVEVEKIKAIKNLIDGGLAISHAIETINKKEMGFDNKSFPTDIWQQYLLKIKQAISNFDENALNDAYHEITSLHTVELVTDKLIIPMLKYLGNEWQFREGSVAEEHFFSAFLRNKLGARFHYQNRMIKGKPIIVAGLPGDHHEFGLLLFALALMNQGLRVLLMGPNLPIIELQHTLGKVNAAALVLAGSNDIDLDRLSIKINSLQQQYQIPVFIGGNIAEKYSELFTGINVHPLGNDIRKAIETISNIVPNNQDQRKSHEPV